MNPLRYRYRFVKPRSCLSVNLAEHAMTSATPLEQRRPQRVQKERRLAVVMRGEHYRHEPLLVAGCWNTSPARRMDLLGNSGLAGHSQSAFSLLVLHRRSYLQCYRDAGVMALPGVRCRAPFRTPGRHSALYDFLRDPLSSPSLPKGFVILCVEVVCIAILLHYAVRYRNLQIAGW
jgi:hypothetical protein